MDQRLKAEDDESADVIIKVIFMAEERKDGHVGYSEKAKTIVLNTKTTIL